MKTPLSLIGAESTEISAATPDEIRQQCREGLESLRIDVASCGDRWPLTGDFLKVIDNLLAASDNPEVCPGVLAVKAARATGFREAIRAFDEGGSK
jgi:hypothetical protein